MSCLLCVIFRRARDLNSDHYFERDRDRYLNVTVTVTLTVAVTLNVTVTMTLIAIVTVTVHCAIVQSETDGNTQSDIIYTSITLLFNMYVCIAQSAKLRARCHRFAPTGRCKTCTSGSVA